MAIDCANCILFSACRSKHFGVIDADTEREPWYLALAASAAGGCRPAPRFDVEPTALEAIAIGGENFLALRVANPVLYLASDRARYVTGSAFVIDAGLLTR